MPTRIHALLAVCAICMAIGIAMAGVGILAVRDAAATQARCAEMIKDCFDGLACLNRETD